MSYWCGINAESMLKGNLSAPLITALILKIIYLVPIIFDLYNIYMGYSLHITRREHWTDEDASRAISLQDWKSYVDSDDEMEMETTATATTDEGDTVEFQSEGLAIWRKYSKHGINGNKAWFLFDNGEIEVKNPDTEIRNKMISIAFALNGKVQGDDGEEYNEIEHVQNKAWWKFWS
jgi:hypothetical protein